MGSTKSDKTTSLTLGQSYSRPIANEAIVAECPSGAHLTKTWDVVDLRYHKSSNI